jgi:tRNA pseudouridine32 synthase/23S rRNA pseudouridine746 synthase|tara:strand:- start:157011 stop:157691 length:681 start_codon:yes stop_codon:yes gene_type:complete
MQIMNMTPLRKLAYTPPETPYLDVLYADDDILICNKQTGLLSVPGRAEEMKDCLESRLNAQYGEVYTVHRLDMETSGLMVYARSKDAQRQLNQSFMDRIVTKHYIADVFGVPQGDAGEINLPLICDWPNRPRQKVDFDIGKPATTFWSVVNKSPAHCRVLLKPITGRSHQLRVHMLELGLPILGDSLYAHDAAYTPYERLHLHASLLEFPHPVTKKKLQFESAASF